MLRFLRRAEARRLQRRPAGQPPHSTAIRAPDATPLTPRASALFLNSRQVDT